MDITLGSQLNKTSNEYFQIPNENSYILIYQLTDSSYSYLDTGMTKVDNVGNIIWEKTGDINVGFFQYYDMFLESDGFRLVSFYIQLS